MLWRRKKQIGSRGSSVSGDKVTRLACPECGVEFEVASKIIGEFPPGGKEYHKGGTSHVVCPHCGGLIELR